MIDTELKQKISEIVELSPDKLYSWYRKNKVQAKQITDSLGDLELEPDRNGRIPFRQVVWHYKQSFMKKPKCLNDSCNNPVKWNTTTHQYQQYCCNKCIHEHGSINEKRKRTTKEKYGVDNLFRNVNQIKAARKAKLGVEHANLSEDVKARTKQFYLEKYGVDHPWKNPDVRKKCTDTRNYVYLTDEQRQKLEDGDWVRNQLIENAHTQIQVATQIGVAQSTVGLYARSHGIEFNPKSKVQIQIQEFIKDNTDIDVIVNCRTVLPSKQELDIYLPDLKLAFEVNGVYWHGELQGKHKTYHSNKQTQAAQLGIKLIQIYDVEWYAKRSIVESRILSQLYVNERIYARKCKLVELDTKQSRQFFDSNHIQGFVGSRVCYGLTFNNELVAAMSFGVPRFNRYQYELLRYCSKVKTNVVGGPSRLFSYFINQFKPNNIVSFCDLRWGNGSLYSKLGFECDNENTGPNYVYFKQNEVGRTFTTYSRVKFQKHKLKNLLDSFDPDQSEWVNMQLNGFDRIWDCGNSKWTWTK